MTYWFSTHLFRANKSDADQNGSTDQL